MGSGIDAHHLPWLYTYLPLLRAALEAGFELDLMLVQLQYLITPL